MLAFVNSLEQVRKAISETEVDGKFQSSISDEYKSSWNDVSIQGDYDHYARSVGPQNDCSPTKQENYFSPRMKESDFSNEKQTQRRNRIKLSKSNNQVIRATNVSNQEKIIETNKNKKKPQDFTLKFEKNPLNDCPKINLEHNYHTNKIDAVASLELRNPTLNTNEISKEKENEKDNEEDAEKNVTECDLANPSGGLKLENRKPKLKKHQIDLKRTRHINKHGNEFIPPVATAVDFHEPALSNVVKKATENGLLVENQNLLHRRQPDGSKCRMSTLLMANYLGMEYVPRSHIVTSFSVKPILPPLNARNKRVIRRKRVKKQNSNTESGDSSNRKEESDTNLSNEQDTYKHLAPLRDIHLYKWKHGHASLIPNVNDLHYVNTTPYRLTTCENDVETVFEQIVRWRSKVKHCGKPAMFRRSTSPTLGEVALRRKLTDRLPSRQTHKKHPEVADLQPKEESENWRRPIKERLRQTHNVQLLTSPNIIEGINDITKKEKLTSYSRKLNTYLLNNEILKVSLPDLSLRKRQPVWQRMR